MKRDENNTYYCHFEIKCLASSKNLSWSQNDKISNSAQNLGIVRILRRNFFRETKKETAGQSFSSLCIGDPSEGLKLRGGGQKVK